MLSNFLSFLKVRKCERLCYNVGKRYFLKIQFLSVKNINQFIYLMYISNI